MYRRDHWPKNDNCDAIECKALTAYVRIDGRWTRIGHFGSECHKIELIDLKQEEEDRKVKQKLAEIKSEVRENKVSLQAHLIEKNNFSRQDVTS